MPRNIGREGTIFPRVPWWHRAQVSRISSLCSLGSPCSPWGVVPCEGSALASEDERLGISIVSSLTSWWGQLMLLDLYVAPSSDTLSIDWISTRVTGAGGWLLANHIYFCTLGYLVSSNFSSWALDQSTRIFTIVYRFFSYLRVTYDVQVWQVLLTRLQQASWSVFPSYSGEVRDVTVVVLRKTYAEILRIYQFVASWVVCRWYFFTLWSGQPT